MKTIGSIAGKVDILVGDPVPIQGHFNTVIQKCDVSLVAASNVIHLSCEEAIDLGAVLAHVAVNEPIGEMPLRSFIPNEG